MDQAKWHVFHLQQLFCKIKLCFDYRSVCNTACMFHNLKCFETAEIFLNITTIVTNQCFTNY